MANMRAMVLERPRTPLVMRERPLPEPGAGELLIEVKACGVCRTDLHVVDGELDIRSCRSCRATRSSAGWRRFGAGVSGFALGRARRRAMAGRDLRRLSLLPQRPGEPVRSPGVHRLYPRWRLRHPYVADARYCFPLGENGDDAEIAPWLCAGLIGWRSYRMAGEGEALGLYGFGAAAHILAQVAVWQGRRVYAFTRQGDTAAQDFARSLGAVWAGASEETPPEPLDAAIIFAPVGALVPLALKAVKKGGRVVCGGIHMSDIPSFPYALLWEERQVRSVANLTREDAREFLAWRRRPACSAR